MRRKRSALTRIYHFFIPHKHNGYRPHVFRFASVLGIALALVVLESAYLVQVNFIFPHTNFLGAVLPGALLTLTNDDRAANDIPVVSENDQLTQAAQDVANDMATKGYFAHVSPSGMTPWNWLAQVGYKYQYAGENLAVNFTDSSAVESAWMASPTHHANIVKPQYTQMGIGVANGTYQGKDATFVVSFFGTPESASSQSQEPVAVASAPKAVDVGTASPVAVSTGTSTTAPVAQILGTQAQAATPAISSSITNFFTTVTTSPTSTITKILSVLAIIVLVLLVVAIIVKISVQFIEIIAGGLILLLIILGFLFLNGKSIPKIQVSSDNQSSVTNLGT